MVWIAGAIAGLSDTWAQQGAWIYAQRVSQLVNVQQRDVPLAALHCSHVRAMDTSFGGERLLRQAYLPPLSRYLAPERHQDFFAHDPSTIRALMPMCLQTISSILLD